MQLGRDARAAEHLEELLAALGRHGGIGETVMEDCWSEAFDVCGDLDLLPGFLAAPRGQRKRPAEAFPRRTGDRVVRDHGGQLRAGAGVAAAALELRLVLRAVREEREV